MSSSKPKLPYRFEMDERGKCVSVYQDERGQWFENPLVSFPSTAKDLSSERDTLEKDVGIILRITNPIDASGKSKVLILAGNHGFGTESAVNFVADSKQAESLHNIVQYYDFEALFEASVGKKRGLRLGFRKLSILKGGVWQPISVA